MNPSVPHQYDPANARFLAGLAAAAYRDGADAAWLAVNAPETDVRAIIACEGQDCVVAFRGTQDLRNWLTDLDCAFARVGNLRVHRGFYQALESVRANLAAKIRTLDYRRLWFTGHSLGGALAMLCADAWDGPVEGVYTFGQPRAGDAAFRAKYNDRLGPATFRVVHADDIVPRVPWLLARYRHAGHEVFYPSASSQGAFLDRPWWTRLAGDARSLAGELCGGKLAFLDDHHISRYLALFPEPRMATSLSLARP